MNIHDKEVPEITPEQEKKLRNKVFLRILGFTFVINLIMYMDKATFSYSALADMGFWEATGLDQNKYNNCNTVFYAGFAFGQIFSPYLIQKISLTRLMMVISGLWSILIFLHCTAFNYPGVIILRLCLGLTEALAIPILTSTNAMFMTEDERSSTQPIFFSSCFGSSIPIGFIAYGALSADASIKGFRVLNIIIGGMTVILTMFIALYYPNNPADNRLFTTEEKVWIIRRVQSTTNTAVDQKSFKRSHALEALKDYISYLFCASLFLEELANNLTYQQNLLYSNLGGITNLDSTLVNVAGSGFTTVWAWFASLVISIFPNTSFFAGIWSMIPALLGAILAVSLDYSNTIGMLAGILIASQSFGVHLILAFGLAKATARSQTKQKVRAAMMMMSYAIANIISPQLWQEKDGPRYYPAWIVQIVLSFICSPLLMGVIWFILAKRNRERRKVIDSGEVEKVGIVKDSEGNELVVSVAALDLTDLEDKSYIYPL
ncbi:MFS general substrate transporter [Hyphopichia burtonii NRRL Y-1933]|uniref:MFS general substrate transporter n=1 Tax=Hyphopichia burtonii NRRL Y-1933 TaxID=984485 RepID=A0A1E4REW7_9ASCO|nr:MFS general substrate transporter [Hyphopichia burtonii NRRL Y-1933]ODV65756.1 MFS general substrate transporter [Hyphopichia burtonii NRRL Y-1933]